jgi:hypothetical protein
MIASASLISLVTSNHETRKHQKLVGKLQSRVNRWGRGSGNQIGQLAASGWLRVGVTRGFVGKGSITLLLAVAALT